MILPPGNCSSLPKEKWEAVSWALSKDVHPSLFEVDDKVAPESATTAGAEERRPNKPTGSLSDAAKEPD